MDPDVSIVLVTYNRAKFLPRTLDCVLGQTYANFELLICDDCSTDETETICHDYASRDNRIEYIRNPVNLGMPGNLNSGIARTSGEFIANLHDGDIYRPTLIEKWRAALTRHPTAGFVFNMYRHLDPDGQPALVTDKYGSFLSGKEFLELCFRDTELECPVWGTTMVRRSVYEGVGPFKTKYGFWSDFDMWFRIADSYDVAFVPEPLIDLPSRAVQPHLFDDSALKAHSAIFRMYWAARRRHFRDQPLRLARELSDQAVQFTSSRTRRIARRLFAKPAIA